MGTSTTSATKPDYQQIQVDICERILTITLNRPDQLNAFTGRMLEEMLRAFDEADQNDDVRVVIVTGAGRGFCAGADLSAGGATFADSESPDAPARQDARPPRRDGGGLLTLRIFNSRVPVIAAINGPAVGVGVTMTLPMDIRLASSAAKFGFARRGIVPEACSSWFLPRVVGISRAMQWCATGRVFDAQEALAGGLVSEVVAPDELLPRARALATEIASSTSALSIAVTRQLLWRMLGADHPMEAHKFDSRAISELGRNADAREGVTSFLEKRPANFRLSANADYPQFMDKLPDPPFA